MNKFFSDKNHFLVDVAFVGLRHRIYFTSLEDSISKQYSRIQYLRPERIEGYNQGYGKTGQ
jgi:hypothetical protein